MAFKLVNKLSVLAILLIVWLLLVAMIALPHRHATASNTAQPGKVSSARRGLTEHVGYRGRVSSESVSRGTSNCAIIVCGNPSPPGGIG
ncbi:hypothetical protein RJ641_020532 [Dillenia turbinata]|uniref:Uncharacterized protein n=1 Tax=Dillenia turbinata TaxID=194707 RepID=A0AAN8UH52_9MAGN